MRNADPGAGGECRGRPDRPSPRRRDEDHVAKPIRLEELIAKIAHWTSAPAVRETALADRDPSVSRVRAKSDWAADRVRHQQALEQRAKLGEQFRPT
jgi:hypothetical protein